MADSAQPETDQFDIPEFLCITTAEGVVLTNVICKREKGKIHITLTATSSKPKE